MSGKKENKKSLANTLAQLAALKQKLADVQKDIEDTTADKVAGQKEARHRLRQTLGDIAEQAGCIRIVDNIPKIVIDTEHFRKLCTNLANPRRARLGLTEAGEELVDLPPPNLEDENGHALMVGALAPGKSFPA